MEKTLRLEQEGILGSLLRFMSVLGIIAWVPSVWASILHGFTLVAKGSNPLTVGIIGSNLLLICLALAIVIRLLLDRLGASILESRSYATRLAAELAEIRKIKQDLEKSLEEKTHC
jgi:hypothetical protein